MSDIDELKLCPFCGGATPVVDLDKNRVECQECGGMMIYFHRYPVTEEWNQRDYEKNLEELRASYDEYGDRLSAVVEDSLRKDADLARLTAENKALRDEALMSVLGEREKQESKWGEQNHDPFTYLAILSEEVGEFAQAALQTKFGGKHGGLENMRMEAVHTAAVALAIVQCLDRGKWRWSETK